MTKWTKILMTHLAGLCFFSSKRMRMFSSRKLKTPSVFDNQKKVASDLFPFCFISISNHQVAAKKEFVSNVSLFSSMVQVKCDLIRPWHKLLAILWRNEPVSCFSIRHNTGFCTDFMIQFDCNISGIIHARGNKISQLKL